MNCQQCGQSFEPSKYAGKKARYCSALCRQTYVNAHRQTSPESKRAYARQCYRNIRHDPERRAKRQAYDKEAHRRLREWLAQYKLERGCCDCGFRAHSAALQLDHNGPKTAAISEIRSSVKRMLAEIKAGCCAVRCANCHAIKTWREKNGLPA